MPGYLSRIGIAVLSLALLAAPALSQTPIKTAAEILLTTGDAPVAVTVIGNIRAEAHQKSMITKVSGRDMVNQQLRDQALKLGADAVVNITYEDNNPMFSKKGFIAVGKAVKFSAAPATAQAAPAPAAPPVQAASVQVAAPPVVGAAAPAVVAVVPAPVPAAARGPTPAALVALTEQDLVGRAYTRIGPVSAEAHQTSMFPKTPIRETLNDNLRAAAAKMGADAVILIKYTDSNPMTSKKGFTAAGIAVKFGAPAAPASLAAALPPAPVVTPPPVLTAQLAPAPVLPPPAATPTPASKTTVAIVLTEQNITGRAYGVLGPVNAEVNPATLSLDKTGREVLDEDLRRQAAKLGADAVILIRYAPATAGKGPTAIGVAVKFQ